MHSAKYSLILLSLVFYLCQGFNVTAVAQDRSLEKILQNPFDFSSRCEIGDKDFYHIVTMYLDMNDSGMVAQKRVLHGYFSREVMRMDAGRRYDRFQWKAVKAGQRQGKGGIRDYQTLPYTEGFQYEYCQEDWEPEHFPVDLTTIPKTMEGWSFVVKLLDTHTFDTIVDFKEYQGSMQSIGDTARLPAENVPVNMDFPPLFTDTYFTNAFVFTTFKGVTLYRGEPCAILSFRSDDSRVHMTVNMMDMKLPTDGVSYYWGDIYCSLETGKIIWGQIIEWVHSVTTMVQMGKPVRHVTRREIMLERMTEDEYGGI